MSEGEGGHRPPSSSLPEDYFRAEAGAALIDQIRMLPGPRVLVAIAGAPGSGKSTLAAGVVRALPDAVLVPMDGFHLDDTLLSARGLYERKGAVETFDAAGFAVLVQRLSVAGSEVVFPLFDRTREIAIAGAGVVRPDHRVVVIEGNYLLLDGPPWNALNYDLTIQLAVSDAVLQQRLEARWAGLGKPAAVAAAHVANDLANARHVTAGSRPADRILVLEEPHERPGDR